MNCWFETSIRWLLRVHLQRIVYSKHSCSYSFMIFYGPLKMKSSTNLYHRRSQFPLWIRCSHQKKSLQTNYTPSRWPLQSAARPCSWARRLGDVRLREVGARSVLLLVQIVVHFSKSCKAMHPSPGLLERFGNLAAVRFLFINSTIWFAGFPGNNEIKFNKWPWWTNIFLFRRPFDHHDLLFSRYYRIDLKKYSGWTLSFFFFCWK